MEKLGKSRAKLRKIRKKLDKIRENLVFWGCFFAPILRFHNIHNIVFFNVHFCFGGYFVNGGAKVYPLAGG